MMAKGRRPVSRVDSHNTHGWFARVYRGSWVGSRSFADRQYGSRSDAEAAANKWVRLADERLPIIPPKPVLKVAKFKLRKYHGDRYYDVYLPMPRKGKPKLKKLYCNDIRDMDRQGLEAYRLVTQRNAVLEQAHRLAFAAWKRERDRIMQEIARMWPAIKTMLV